MHTIIHGLDIYVSTYNIHIECSCTVESPKEMSVILTTLKVQIAQLKTVKSPFDNRTIESMINEWVSHNNCYKLGIAPDRTASVDLNYPQPWYMPIVYWLTSRIVL